MKDINKFINESTAKNPGVELLEINETGKYGYMYYDPNSGIVSTYSMNGWKDLVDDFSADEDYAKDLEKLKVGQSLEDDSNTIYTRIW